MDIIVDVLFRLWMLAVDFLLAKVRVCLGLFLNDVLVIFVVETRPTHSFCLSIFLFLFQANTKFVP